MDKTEYKIRVEEINSLCKEGRLSEAAAIADTIDWRRVKNHTTLCKISDIYKANRRLQESHEILVIANDRNPGKRDVLFSMCELEIAMGDFIQAIETYKEFVRVAPKDTGRYMLQYKLYQAQEVSLEEQIQVLEELKKHDYRDKWGYELAYLYHRIGLATECVEECNELFTWFHDGRFVIKALELKQLHAPLTEPQKAVYRAAMGNLGQINAQPSIEEDKDLIGVDQATEQMDSVAVQNLEAATRQSAGYGYGQAPAQESYVQPGDVSNTQSFNVYAQPYGGEAPYQMQADAYGQPYLQQEAVYGAEYGQQMPYDPYAAEPQQGQFGAAQDVREGIYAQDGAPIGNMQLEQYADPYAQYQAPTYAEQVPAVGMTDESMFEGVSQDTREVYEQTFFNDQPEQEFVDEPVVPTPDYSSQFNTMNLQQALAEDMKKVMGEDGSYSVADPAQTQVFSDMDQAQILEVFGQQLYREDSVSQETQIYQQVPQSYAQHAQVLGQLAQPATESAIYNTQSIYADYPLEAERPGNVIRPMQTQAPDPFDSMLTQDYDGQISMAMPEEKMVEKQITGQISISDIMNGLVREQQAKQTAQVHQRLAAETDELLSEFDEQTRKSLQSKIEKVVTDALMGNTEQAAEAVYNGDIVRPEGDVKPYVLSGAADLLRKEDTKEAFGEEGAKTEDAAGEAEASDEVDSKALIEGDEGASENDESVASETQASADDSSDAAKEPDAENAEASETAEAGDEADDEVEDEDGAEAEAEASDDAEAENSDEAASEEDEDTDSEEAQEIADDAETFADESEEETAEEENSDTENEPSADEDASEEVDKTEEPDAEDAKAEEEAAQEEEPDGAEDTEAEDPASDKVAADAQETDGSEEKAPPRSPRDVREDNRVRAMTPEEKDLFGPYIHHRKSRRQIIRAIDSLNMNAAENNAIVTGAEGAGTVNLAKGLIQSVQAADIGLTGKVAKISAESLNHRDVKSILDKLPNGALIIEQAADLQSDTLSSLQKELKNKKRKMIVIIEDLRPDMDRMLKKNPALKEMFTVRVDIEALDNDSLVNYAKQYALDREYAIDNLGILALHTRIDDMQTIDHDVTISEVRDIVDEAIESADRGSIGHFFDVLFQKRYDEEDMIILREKDFA